MHIRKRSSIFKTTHHHILETSADDKTLQEVNTFNEPREKNTDSSFDVTMGSYDGAGTCKLVWIYIQPQMANAIKKNDYRFCDNDGLIILQNTNRPKSRSNQKVCC